MYENLLKINKNIITVNSDKFREIGQYPENQDELIQYIIKINKKILKKHGSFSYKFSVKSLSLSDLQHYNFFRKFILQVQDIFKDELDTITVEDTNEIVRYLFSYISVFFAPDILYKVKFI
jgi:hypothetical protein